MPAGVKLALETLPPSSHPMEVLRSAVSILGSLLPEKESHGEDGAREIADRLMASLGSMLLYWYHYAAMASAFRWKPMTTPSAAISCTCFTASPS